MARKRDLLPTCDPNLTPIVADRSDLCTPRRAVDSSGRVGMLYDACCDQVFGQSNIGVIMQPNEGRKPPTCFVEKYNTEKSACILELINMHHELQLSIAIEGIQANGIGALINYSLPLDKYTRFITYNYYSQTDYLSDDEYISLTENKLRMLDARATHIIVLVNWGIDSTVVLQLPPDDTLVEAIDYAIKKLCAFLSKHCVGSDFSAEDVCCFQNIVHTEVFSNIPDLTKTNSLIDFYHNVSQVKNNINLHKPYNYNLCPVNHLYSVQNITKDIFQEVPLELKIIIKHDLFQLSRHLKKLGKAIDRDYPNLQQHLKQQLHEMRERWSKLKEMYKSEVEQLRNSVINFRRGKIIDDELNQAFNSNMKKELSKNMDYIGYELSVMQKKERLIGDLLEKHFEYVNAADRGIENADNPKMLESKLLMDEKRTCIICFDDTLCERNKSEWDKLFANLLEEHKANPQLRFICVDFTYCSRPLDHFVILPATRKNSTPEALKEAITILSKQKEGNEVTQKNHEEDTVKLPTKVPVQRPISNEIINILLLGESGVGKSTFINAFVNYLKFNTLKKAQNNAVVLIPVSFVMTSGDNFKEHTVKFGEQDSIDNEVHAEPGQAVTQHCRSYVFTLKNDGNESGKKLRIIDTPGIGDARGLAQDDINMQHILSYINNFTHLNAICILMKPNNARLNIFFRSCFAQLFDMFGENIRDKIIFCFTNARATFYTPGNTAPLLKKMLESLPVKEIPFNKENTFCFDSESFRYLVAVQNEIEFNGIEEKEYEESWNKSSTESKRFLRYIRTKTTELLYPNESKSTKHAQLKISLMLRPILETMRNILRNTVLWDRGSRMVSIELRTKKIESPTGICFECNRETYKVNDFWVTADCLHVFQNKCRTCSHDFTQHMRIYYELEWKECKQPMSQSDDEIRKMLNDLCKTSAEFAHFLSGTQDISQNDPFLLGFKRMIKEESDICANKGSCQLNSALLKELEQLNNIYEDIRKKMKDKGEHISLSNIYEKIQRMCKYRMIESQMAAITEWEKFMIKHYEHEVLT